MSEYFDNKDLFMQPKTTQYGSHMVMTNVSKNTKTKYINIDTRFRDEYNYSQLANYTITLPERITDVKTMTITNMEIPKTIYNISSNRGNSYFKVTNTAASTSHIISILDSEYLTITSVMSSINTQLHIFDVSFSMNIDASTNHMYFSSIQNNYTVQFDVDSTGGFDKNGIRAKLGWILGFRKASYTVPSTNTKIKAEALSDVAGVRYLFLAVDEFCKGNQNSFISPLPLSLINKNIIARIPFDSKTPFGNIIIGNNVTGDLLSDTRSYTGKIDLQRINVQLLDEYGTYVDLNGLDFSLCMKLEHE